MKPAPSLENKTAFTKTFHKAGCCLWPKLLSTTQTSQLKAALALAIVEERPLHRTLDDESLVVCCPWYDDIFLDILRGNIFAGVDALLGDDCIIYNYNNSCLKPGQGNFSSHIHVERYYTTGNHLEAVGVMILLDDFTEENGASWFLLGSQHEEAQPEETSFFKQAERLLAPAGSVFFFHPHLWHAGGINRTNQSREALTVGFCQPYMKQRLDMPAIFTERKQHYSEDIIQKLGFLAQSPTSIKAFYQQAGSWSQKINGGFTSVV